MATFDLSTVEVIKENYAPIKTGRVFTAASGLSARPAASAGSEWDRRIAASADPLAVWKECVLGWPCKRAAHHLHTPSHGGAWGPWRPSLNLQPPRPSFAHPSPPPLSPPPHAPSHPFPRYIAHTEASNPSGGPLLLQLLERATRAYVSEERYRNDPRYIELWVAYADLLPEPGDVFKYLHANRIGEDCALLFMAWAWCAEHKGNFAFADKVFARGLARKAAPLDRLTARYRQFQRRMYKKWVAAQGGAGGAGQGGEPKVDLEALTAAMRDAVAGPGGKVVLPDLRAAQASAAAAAAAAAQPLQAPQDENGAPRAALGRITAHAAARSHRPTAFAEDGAYREDGGFDEVLGGDGMGSAAAAAAGARRAAAAHVGMGLFAPTRGGATGAPSSSGAQAAQQQPGSSALPTVFAAAKKPAAPPLVIFQDEGLEGAARAAAPGSGPAPRPAAAAPLPSALYRVDELGVQYAAEVGGSRAPLASRRVELGTEAARRKENEEAPAKWNVLGPLPVHAGTRAIAPPTRAADSRIPIYVDDNRKGEEPAAPLPAPLRLAAQGAAAVKPAASASASTAEEGSGGEAAEALSYEEVRAAAWLLAHPAISAEISACRERVCQGLQCSVYDGAARGGRGATAAAPTASRATPVAAAAAAAPHGSTAAMPSPAYPTSFSPGLQSSGTGGRTVRESMLNRLFEDVDEEQEQAQAPGAGKGSDKKQGSFGLGMPSLATSGSGAFHHLSGFGLGGEDLSSIQGDGVSHGNIAVTVHTQMDFRGLLRGADRRAQGVSASTSAIPIFSDFDDVQPQQVRPPPLPQQQRPAPSASSLYRPSPPPQAQRAAALPLAALAASAAEDVTINTRLAMNDLDGMFSSPSSKFSSGVGGGGGASGGRGAQGGRGAPAFASLDAAEPARHAAVIAQPTRIPTAAAAAAPPPPPPPQPVQHQQQQQQQQQPSSDGVQEGASAPVLKARALPPDARRLSLGFSLNRRQSGMGLPSGRASISHAHLPAPMDRRGGAGSSSSISSSSAVAAVPPPPPPTLASAAVAAAAAAAAHPAPAAAAAAHVQSPLPASPILPPSFRPLPPPQPFRIAVDDGESVEGGSASSVDSVTGECRGEEEGGEGEQQQGGGPGGAAAMRMRGPLLRPWGRAGRCCAPLLALRARAAALPLARRASLAAARMRPPCGTPTTPPIPSPLQWTQSSRGMAGSPALARPCSDEGLRS